MWSGIRILDPDLYFLPILDKKAPDPGFRTPDLDPHTVKNVKIKKTCVRGLSLSEDLWRLIKDDFNKKNAKFIFLLGDSDLREVFELGQDNHT
jgi:hypothetical protein